MNRSFARFAQPSRSWLLALPLAATLVACPQSGGGTTPGGGTNPSGPVATVTVTPSNPSLAVGGTTTLTAVAKDAAGNVVNGVTFLWVSSKPEIASVTQTGKVTAVSAGITDIAARSTPGDKLGGVEVTVTGGGTPPAGAGASWATTSPALRMRRSRRTTRACTAISIRCSPAVAAGGT